MPFRRRPRSTSRRFAQSKIRTQRRLLLEKLEAKQLFAVLTDSISPLPNSNDAAVDANIVVDFDQNIDPTTVSDATLVIHGGQTGRLLASAGTTFGTVDDVVTVNPDDDFFPGEIVQGTITGGVQNTGNSQNAQPKVFQFRAGVSAVAGDLSDSGQTLSNPARSRDVKFGDVDGDGDLDAFVANAALGITASHQIWLNEGGNFSLSGQTLSHSSNSLNVSLGDVDGDGDLDAFVSSSRSNHQVWINDGGNFSLGQSLNNTAPTVDVNLGDIDGDGDLDAFINASASGYDHQIWANNGGNFSLSQTLSNSSRSQSLSLGDLDGDGDLDAFLAGSGNDHHLWINTGGSFSLGQTLTNSSNSKVELGDLDGDGDLDAFLIDASGSRVANHYIWANEGGSFSLGQTLSNSVESADVVLGDIDGDGDLDALVASVSSYYDPVGQPHQLWINNAGNFTPGEKVSSKLASRGVDLGDVDGDGDLDAFVVNDFGNHQLIINDFAAPTVDLAVSSSAGTETDESVITLTATASAPVQGDQTVDVDVTGMGITNGDYTLSSTSITIPDGQTTGTVTFTVVDDAVAEANETAEISISNPSAGIALGSTTSQSFSIEDNDDAGFQLIETGGGTIVSQGGTTDTFDVVLTAAPASEVRFDLFASDTDKATVFPPFLIFGPDNWDVRQPVFVQGSEASFGSSQIDVRVNDSESDDQFDPLGDMHVTVETLSIEEPHIYQAGKELFLLGSHSRDQISVRESNGNVVAQVISYLPDGVVPELKTVQLDAVEGIEINGFDGNDTITAIGLTVPVLLNGGSGNDQLTGGLANDILIGGPGDDRITGNTGDDLLIGGDDLDILFDGPGADIVISGRTEIAGFTPALRAILDEWTSSRTYEQRVDNITNDSPSSDRLNDEFFLDDILGDSDVDRVFGDAAGQDLFFVEEGVDLLLGKRPNEELINTPDL